MISFEIYINDHDQLIPPLDSKIGIDHRLSIMKEGNVLFNNALNTFYLRLYSVKHGKGQLR